jgi:hypothetical protein
MTFPVPYLESSTPLLSAEYSLFFLRPSSFRVSSFHYLEAFGRSHVFTDRTTALIVGAGPTGLATALSLLHHGFHDFIIVDALPQGRISDPCYATPPLSRYVLFLIMLLFVSKP